MSSENVRIYGLIDPRNGNCRYIGKTKNSLMERLRGHLNTSRSASSSLHVSKWIRLVMADNAVPEIFEVETVSNCDWRDAERFWISYFRSIGCSLTNIDPGGGGIEMSKVVREKISATRKAKNLRPSADAQERSMRTRAQRWKDPEFRDARSKRTSETQKALWQNSTHRTKMVNKRKEVWSRIKADPQAMQKRRLAQQNGAAESRSATGAAKIAKLSVDQVLNVRFLRGFGQTIQNIADVTGIPFGTVYSICSRSTWKHLP
jgi:hypothetical protein